MMMFFRGWKGLNTWMQGILDAPRHVGFDMNY